MTKFAIPAVVLPVVVIWLLMAFHVVGAKDAVIPFGATYLLMALFFDIKGN